MKICLDAQAAVSQRAGIARYARCLAEAMAPRIRPDELQLFWLAAGVSDPLPPDLPSRTIGWLPRRLVRAAWRTIAWPPFDRLAGPADVYHFPDFVLPPLRRGRSVVTVHDVAFLRMPETGDARNVRYLISQVRESVRRADAVITDSRFVAREVEELLGAAPERVHPIPLGVSMRRPDTAAIDETLRRLGIDRPYLLHVGRLEPRKNLPFLVEVFERLERFDGHLVLAGSRGWKDGPILRRISESSRASRILRPDFVDERDLPALYAGAEAFVFPTRYEGFGLPPLEAMACEAPVVAAAVGAIPEVVGEAGVLVEGHDPARWVAALERVVDDGELRRSLCEKGRTRAAGLTWDKTARATIDVYRRVHDGP